MTNAFFFYGTLKSTSVIEGMGIKIVKKMPAWTDGTLFDRRKLDSGIGILPFPVAKIINPLDFMGNQFPSIQIVIIDVSDGGLPRFKRLQNDGAHLIRSVSRLPVGLWGFRGGAAHTGNEQDSDEYQ